MSLHKITLCNLDENHIQLLYAKDGVPTFDLRTSRTNARAAIERIDDAITTYGAFASPAGKALAGSVVAMARAVVDGGESMREIELTDEQMSVPFFSKS